jgi:hypothetical protein
MAYWSKSILFLLLVSMLLMACDSGEDSKSKSTATLNPVDQLATVHTQATFDAASLELTVLASGFESVQVIEHEWQSSIVIHKFTNQQGYKDCSDIPDNAYNITRSSETRSRQVADGQTCRQECTNKDDDMGTFTRTCQDVCEPKYRTENYSVAVCDYSIDEWVFERELKSEGTGIAVETPQFNLAEAEENGLGAEKVVETSTTYILKFKRSNSEILQCEFENRGTWEEYPDGQTILLKINSIGMPDCSEIHLPEQNN